MSVTIDPTQAKADELRERIARIRAESERTRRQDAIWGDAEYWAQYESDAEPADDEGD